MRPGTARAATRKTSPISRSEELMASRYPQELGFLIKGRLGRSEAVQRPRRANIEEKLAEQLDDLLLGRTGAPGVSDPVGGIGFLAQGHEGGDGAEGAGLQVEGRGGGE